MANSHNTRSNVSEQSPRRVQRITHVQQLLSTLLARRKALKYSQAILAEKLGIHQTHLSDIEQGKRTLSVERLLALMTILELELLVQQRADRKHEW